MLLNRLRCCQQSVWSLAALYSLLLSIVPMICVAQGGSSALVIDRVSGCTDSGAVTTECPLQATITIHLATTPNPAITYLGALIEGPNWVSESVGARLDTTDTTQRTWTITVLPSGYRPLWTGTALNITLSSRATNQYSAPFPGVSFAYVPPPTLTAISGCAKSDAAGTYGCMPDVDVLTIRGSGLSWLSLGRNTAATLEDIKTGIYLPLTYVNDSYMLFPLSQSYETLVLPVHYSGATLQLGFQSYTYIAAPNDEDYFEHYNTNTLPISFVPLPPPNVTSIYVSNCNNTDNSNQPAYFDCLPGVSGVGLVGSYMYELTVLLAGVPCVATSALPTRFQCTLPLIDSYTPGQQYPISIYNDAGNITQKATVSYTAQPTIATLVPCSDHADAVLAASAYCQPGSQLTIVGSRFPINDPTVQVTLTSRASPMGGGSAVTVFCLSAAVQDSSTVVCTLPLLNSSIAAAFAGQSATVRVLFNSGSVATNTFSRVVYDYANAPVVTAASASDGSCSATNSPLTLASCQSSAVFTITGSGFVSGEYLSVQANSPVSNNAYYYINTCEIVSNTTTTIVCTMPVIELVTAADAVVAGYQYTWFVLQYVNGTRLTSNRFRVTYAAQDVEPESGLSSTGASLASDSTLSSGATAGVAIAAVVLVAVTAAAMFFFLRHRRTAASDSPKSDNGVMMASQQQRSEEWKSSDSHAVEMPVSPSRY